MGPKKSQSDFSVQSAKLKKQNCGFVKMVGKTRLELATPASQTQCASQLRHFPTYYKMVGVPGFEPGTSSLSETRSNQLSYTPIHLYGDYKSKKQNATEFTVVFYFSSSKTSVFTQ
jgi:hypothetical protein